MPYITWYRCHCAKACTNAFASSFINASMLIMHGLIHACHLLMAWHASGALLIHWGLHHAIAYRHISRSNTL
jgi:hypothetical protein